MEEGEGLDYFFLGHGTVTLLMKGKSCQEVLKNLINLGGLTTP